MVESLFAKWQTSLDDQALDAIAELDAQETLEILEDLDAKSSSVRNPSAYVQRACENRKKGHDVPGLSVEVLSKYESSLDASALDALRRVGATQATVILQKLEACGGSVRNPSAYVARSVANLERGDSAAGTDLQSQLSILLAKWRFSLDQKAAEAVMALGPQGAFDVLKDLEGKSGSVRNPSAYVQRAVENRAAIIERLLLQSQLDVDALNELEKVPPKQIKLILNNLKSRGASVRNPSAYVRRSVANLQDSSGDVEGRTKSHDTTPGISQISSDDGNSNAELDADAQTALSELAPDVAQTILADLESKGATIRNPSAYVQRAVGNTRKGEGAAINTATPSAFDAEHSEKAASLVSILDDDAQAALNNIGPEGADAIIQQLVAGGDKVRNPSAYVLRAVVNARKGIGAGAVAAAVAKSSVAAHDNSEQNLESLLEQWRPNLDDEAVAALEAVGPKQAGFILSGIEGKLDKIRNLSAYIVRSVCNAKSGNQPSAAVKVFTQGQVIVPPNMLASCLAQLPTPLDEKALSALHEVGPAAASNILQSLLHMGDQVVNPSAYVMKGVANEKRGLNSQSLPSAKRLRV